MQLKRSTIALILLWSLFMGVTAISIGFGALLPPLNYVASPFVCLGGKMSTEEQVYNVSPVETVTTITWYCTDASTGARKELSIWTISFAAGLIYGLLLFLAILAVLLIRARRSAPDDNWLGVTGKARFGGGLETRSSQAATIAQAKIDELTELRDADQISEEEFQRRKRDIISKLSR